MKMIKKVKIVLFLLYGDTELAANKALKGSRSITRT